MSVTFNSNNRHNMFIFILALVTADFLLFSAECRAQSKFDVPKRLDNKIVYDILDERLGKYTQVNLARGTPELFPPLFLRQALTNISLTMNLTIHEYMPPEGYAELRKEIALFYSPLIDRPLNMSENVVITNGVTQGIYLAIFAHTEPGDQWIVLEPAFEDYFVSVEMAGGVPVPVQLKSNSTKGKLTSHDFTFDKDKLRKAFNSKTRGIIINSPHNPTGKSFTKEELLFIGELAVKWNAIILCDDVYEWLNYESDKHMRIASLGKEIFEQTITLSSMSKTFFASGFRVGWAYGSPKLIGNMKAQLPYLIYSGNSYAQVAAVEGIRKVRLEMGHSNSYLENHVNSLKQKRDFALETLDKIGMEVIVPESGFFIYMNYTRLASTIDLEKEDGESNDWKFVSWLVKKTGVLLYPGTGLHLYGNEIGKDFIRLCFAKETEKLNKAATLLKKLNEK